MIFFKELADDHFSWEILGTRAVTAKGNTLDLSIEYFCICYGPFPTTKKRVKSFSLPIDSLRYLRVGSLWKNGAQVSQGRRVSLQVYAETGNISLVLCSKQYSAKEIAERIINSENPHFSFLEHTNYLIVRTSCQVVYIHCTEVIRFFMAPSKRFLKLVMSGGIAEYLSRHRSEVSTPFKPGKISVAEANCLEGLNFSAQARDAARLPYKIMQLSHLSNEQKRSHAPKLLAATIPHDGEVVFYSSITVGKSTIDSASNSRIALQLSRLTHCTSGRVRECQPSPVKIYINPYNKEIIRTQGGNHSKLKEWKAEYGRGEVESWRSF